MNEWEDGRDIAGCLPAGIEEQATRRADVPVVASDFIIDADDTFFSQQQHAAAVRSAARELLEGVYIHERAVCFFVRSLTGMSVVVRMEEIATFLELVSALAGILGVSFYLVHEGKITSS